MGVKHMVCNLSNLCWSYWSHLLRFPSGNFHDTWLSRSFSFTTSRAQRLAKLVMKCDLGMVKLLHSHERMDVISPTFSGGSAYPLQLHNDERHGVSNHRHLDCLPHCLFRRRSKIHQSSASLAFVKGIPWWPVDSFHKGQVTRKIILFDGVIMTSLNFDNRQVNTS